MSDPLTRARDNEWEKKGGREGWIDRGISFRNILFLYRSGQRGQKNKERIGRLLRSALLFSVCDLDLS